MRSLIISVLLFIFMLQPCFAQDKGIDSSASDSSAVMHYTVAQASVENGDTIPMVMLTPFRVAALRPYHDKRLDKKFRRLRRYVTAMYPYAKAAADKMKEYNDTLMEIESKRKRKQYLKKAEEDLKAEFEDDIRDMSMSEGRVLLKLIDRETGDTSYELVKELKGSFSAFFWQSVARLFGSNLKSEFDPKTNKEDEMIDRICQMIEEGQI